MTDEPVKKDIALPVITEPLAHHTYIRPYRSGGVRLELETINDKNIFHNYGQGGSAICMAYGCATISILGISRNIGQEKNVEIAVLGAGINGLMTALELAKRNYHVTIYA
jgi:D-amino-acid oxidase